MGVKTRVQRLAAAATSGYFFNQHAVIMYQFRRFGWRCTLMDSVAPVRTTTTSRPMAVPPRTPEDDAAVQNALQPVWLPVPLEKYGDMGDMGDMDDMDNTDDMWRAYVADMDVPISDEDVHGIMSLMTADVVPADASACDPGNPGNPADVVPAGDPGNPADVVPAGDPGNPADVVPAGDPPALEGAAVPRCIPLRYVRKQLRLASKQAKYARKQARLVQKQLALSRQLSEMLSS